MCGIAGVLMRPGKSARAESLDAMLAMISHRGPDDAASVVEGGVGLAAARLSILDLTSAGAQPFSDGRHALTFNGEIYNYRNLTDRLARAGVIFRGRSDTEVVFHAIRLWGIEETLPLLHGMFAFAFADLVRQCVWLVRDRLGVKPMLWCEADGGLAWASEAKSLRPLHGLRPDPMQATFALTGQVDRSSRRTLFEGVHLLPPGHLLFAAAGERPQVASWWSPSDEVDPNLHADLGERDAEHLADDLEEILQAAVSRMTVSDAPVGAFLSGGVDSSLIAAMATAQTEPPTLFTSDVGGDRSERLAAQSTATHLGQGLVVSAFPREALLDDWARATWHLEAPVITHVNALPFGRVAQTAHDHGMKSVLTGEGADELFFGYTETAAMRYRHALDTGTRARRWASRRVPGPYGPVLAPRGASQADFVAELVGHFERADLEAGSKEAFGFLPPRDAERHGQVLIWLGEHLTTLLHRNDALGMAAGVEARFPFLDETVLRFGINLPVKFKLANSRRLESPKHPFVVNKAIVRRVAARRLPASIAHRPKAGFPMYGYHFLRVDQDFWVDGYVADLLDLPQRAIVRLGSEVDPYLAAKLASVEVFGRLFDRHEAIDAVTEHIRRYARLVS